MTQVAEKMMAVEKAAADMCRQLHQQGNKQAGIGERIKLIRSNRKLTQEAFAQILGISHAHVSKIENGKEAASLTLIKLICMEYGIRKEWLLQGELPMYAIHKEPVSNKEVEAQKSLLPLITVSKVLEGAQFTAENMPENIDARLEKGENEWYAWVQQRFADNPKLMQEVEESILLFYGWLEAKGYAHGMKDGARLMLDLLMD